MGVERALLSGILSIASNHQPAFQFIQRARSSNAYVSFTPLPTPAPLVLTDTVASVNPHAEAVAVGMAAEASKDNWRTECHSCMVNERPNRRQRDEKDEGWKGTGERELW